MTKTVSRRRKVEVPGSLRKKLTGALAMLVIAAIMMVSSTFAWFTLSTAPEVKGISTSIGSNGNLEIMLLDGDSFVSTDDNLGKDSAVGDSIATQGILGNVTWGNLVDLSYADYGLANVVLQPAALNAGVDGSADEGTIKAMPLYGPSYGTDGRVDQVNKATAGAMYDSSSAVFVVGDEDAGVRALGVPSTLSPVASAFNSARSAYNAAVNSAKSIMINSLTAASSPAYALMGLAGTDDGVSAAGFENLNTTIGLLGDANAQVFAAIKAAALMTKFSTLDDASQIATIQSAVEAVTPAADAATLKSNLGTAAGITVTGALSDAIDLYYTTAGKLASAQTAYDTAHTAGPDGTNLTINNTAGQTGYKENTVRGILDLFLDKTHAEIAGVLNPTRNDANALISYANSHGLSIPVTLYGGSGVYSDISKNVGTFDTGAISLAGTMYESYNVSIATSFEKTVSGSTLVDSTDEQKVIILTSATEGLTAAGGVSTTQSFAKGFGYALDFGFRTNAATGSKLLLQTDAVQRIYGDSTNAATAGAGTFIRFTSVDVTKFTVDQLKALMGAIRIVFAEPQFSAAGDLENYEILAVAAPDVASGSAVDTTGWTSPLALYAYTVSAVTGDVAPMLTLGSSTNSVEITTLTQNVGKKISVFVYLDGDVVDNTMVANAATSMTGLLNLQFTTDAALVPMEDAALKNGTAAVDKSLLSAALSNADTLAAVDAAAAAATPDATDTALIDAYDAADAVNNDAAATQAQVNTAIANLAAALEAWSAAHP